MWILGALVKTTRLYAVRTRNCFMLLLEHLSAQVSTSIPRTWSTTPKTPTKTPTNLNKTFAWKGSLYLLAKAINIEASFPCHFFHTSSTSLISPEPKQDHSQVDIHGSSPAYMCLPTQNPRPKAAGIDYVHQRPWKHTKSGSIGCDFLGLWFPPHLCHPVFLD